MLGLEISELKNEEIDDLRHMQALVWQDHFLKERGQEVPLLYRSRKNIESYMTKKGGFCFVARINGKIIGSIICHTWGSVGWFGPFEVLPEYQNRGIGKELVKHAMNFLNESRCSTTGLETMSGSARNVAFYTKYGFKSKKLSYVLFKDLEARAGQTDKSLIARKIGREDIPRLRPAWERIEHGLDYSAEIHATEDHELGEMWEFDDGTDFPNHAILHTYELIDGSMNTLMKLLVADKKETALAMLAWFEERTQNLGKKGIFLRYYQGTGLELADLLDQGYMLNGTLIRMQMLGDGEDTELAHISCWSG